MSLSSHATREDNDMRILMQELTEGKGAVLAGALTGRKALAQLVEQTSALAVYLPGLTPRPTRVIEPSGES